MSYNGWANYATWCVALWIDNEEALYSAWRDVAQDCWDDSEDCRLSGLTGTDPRAERLNAAACDLSERLKDHYDDAAPTLEGFWSDLLTWALQEVNWFEVAKSLLEDINDE